MLILDLVRNYPPRFARFCVKNTKKLRDCGEEEESNLISNQAEAPYETYFPNNHKLKAGHWIDFGG